MIPLIPVLASIFVHIDESIKDHPYTVVYPVQDLIREIPSYTNVPNLNLGFGNNSLINGNSGFNTTTTNPNSLIELIKSTIEPEIWNNGASINYFRGNLVIYAPWYVHNLLN